MAMVCAKAFHLCLAQTECKSVKALWSEVKTQSDRRYPYGLPVAKRADLPLTASRLASVISEAVFLDAGSHTFAWP